MKLELEQQLVTKYPKIFSDYGGNVKNTCMAFGFECGDGWFNLIDTLCSSIQSHCDYINRMYPQIQIQVVAVQVKEKYGSLRFYLDYHHADGLEDQEMEKFHKTCLFIDGMIYMAESMSERNCGQCGASFQLDRNQPFPHSICDACQTIIDDERASKNWT